MDETGLVLNGQLLRGWVVGAALCYPLSSFALFESFYGKVKKIVISLIVLN